MKNNASFFKLFFVLAFISASIGCEETGEPLTLDDIYDATTIDSDPFKAKINGFDYKADFVAGGKENGSFFIIGASVDGSSITIRTQGIQPGLYLGADSSINNIFYKNNIGRQFVSNFPAEDSDVEISIRAFSEANSLASGVFSGTLYSTDSDEKLSITNGAFNSTFIEIPFSGKMKASVNSKSFNSEDCSFITTDNGGIVFQEIIGFETNDSLRITIRIEDSVAVRTYDFIDTDISATYNSNVYSSNLPRYQYNAISGSLVIHRIDYAEKKIIGSFNFEARSLNGQFVSVNNGGFQALVK